MENRAWGGGLFRVLSNISDERSNHRRCSIRKGVLRNFAKFTEKHLRQSLFFNKAYLKTLLKNNFIKKETLAQAFPCDNI